MHHKPIVAITGPKRGGIARFFICISVWLSGGEPKLFLTNKEIKNKSFDALIISGGDDLNHALYENEFCDLDDIISSKRDALEYNLLHQAYSQDKPVLGICRGYQLINVYFGGILDKDISIYYGKIKYSVFPWKKVQIEQNTLLHTIFDAQTIKINTLHHQAVKKPGAGFTIVCRDNFGIIQAIQHKKKTIFGVQWHPEYLFYRSKQLKIFKTLIQKALEHM